MVTIQDLFKYKKPAEIKNDKGEVAMTVWVRLLGDWDLDQSYRVGRVRSAKVRKELRDTTSDEYFAEISIVEEGETEDLIELIKQSKQTDFYAQAQSAIDRKDLEKMEDFAVDPDAPTLEEQEKKDISDLQNEVDYQTKLNDYVATKNSELIDSLNSLDREVLVKDAVKALVDLRALSAFIDEVLDQKVFRGTFLDKECKNKAFKEYEEFQNQHTSVKNQLRKAYQDLELNPDELKN